MLHGSDSKTAQSSSLSTPRSPEAVGLADPASCYWGASPCVSGSSDVDTSAVWFYIMPPLSECAFKRKPSDKNKSAKPEFTRELLWNIKERAHVRRIADECHMAKSRFNKCLKQDPERTAGLPPATQAENSPSNTPLPDTCQWHLIAIASPSASLSHGFDWLPSHRWLCWTNLKSACPYAASPTGTRNLLWAPDCSNLSYSLWAIDWWRG